MDDDEDTGSEEDSLRAALRRLLGRADEPSSDDIIALWNAAPHYPVALLPQGASSAISAMLETRRDVDNGGVDQVVWNHGAERSRSYAAAWREVGMVDNAALLVRLADSLDAYFALHGQETISADLVHHFIAWRKSVGGPEFGIPEPQREMSEPLLEYVLAHRSELPDPDIVELVRKSADQ